MFTTLVAVLCLNLLCVEEIVTDSSMSDINFQQCLVQGQLGIVKWMSEHPLYRDGWRLEKWKCVPGHYSPPGRA